MTKFRVMGVLLVLLTVLVAVSMVLNAKKLWFVTDIMMLLMAGASGIILIRHKA